MSERQVLVRIKAEIGDFRKQMQEASKVTEQVGKTTEETAKRSGTALGQMVQSANRHEEAWSKSGGALLGFGAAVSVGVGLAIKSYMEFDKAMSEVQAATHASAGDMEQLREAAIKAGADTSYSAKEAADAITELSKAGVTTKDILGGGLTGALSLAAAGSMEVADAAELAATAMVQFKLKGDQIPHLADLLAAGAGKAQGSVQDLGAALNQSGLLAASTGLSIEETTGGLAAFASAGLLGSDAGTSFKTMLQSLTPNSKAAKEEMERLGFSAVDADGNFKSLSEIAGGLRSSMFNLSEAERAASMEIIFGSDAVRAANVLYEQGAKGIEDWTAKVNDSGYAAATAAIKQDNLSGDIEKLGGSLDSVFLKSGSGANEVLRGLAQGAESLVDAIGGIPGPLLQTTLGLAATTGGAALLGGAFLTTFPKVLETKRAFDELAESSPKTASGLGKVGKAAALAGGALIGLQIAGAISKSWGGEQKTVEDYAQAFLTLKTSTADLDAVVRNTGGLGTQINGVGDALVRVNEFDWYDNLNNWAGDMIGGTSKTQQFRDSIKGLDNTLVSLVQNGGAKKAGESFKILSDEANKSAEAQGKTGLSTEQMLKLMPQYTEELKRQGTALGLKLTTEELHDLALGKIPPRMEAIKSTTEGAAAAEAYQAQVSEEAAKKLEDMGLSADGTVVSLSKLLDVMFQTGLASMSARDAEAAYQETLDGLKVKIDEVKASQSEGNLVWDAAKNSFDLTSEAGRAANGVFGDLESKARATTEAMAANGATQDELGVKLGETYTSLYDTARAFGASEEKADALARAALGIPEGVPIETAIQNYADSMAKLHAVDDKANKLNGKVANVYINTHESITKYLTEKGASDLNLAQNGGATGGKVSELAGFAGGGKVPGRAPRDLTKDNILALVDGKPFGLQSEEWVINGKQSRANDHWLRAVNDGLNLDDVFAARYSAPSKSMAGGYGQALFQGGTGGNAAGAMNVSLDGLAVYVTNPFTGEQVRAIVSSEARREAAGVVSAADAQSRFHRKG